MDAETTQEMRHGEWSGEAPSLESLRELHMTALLNDVVGELGQVKAAERLGIDRKTLWRCMTTGKLTPRLSDALERLLLSRDLSAAMRQGKRVEEVVDRVSALEEKLRSGLEAVVGEVKALREEHARAMRHVERRLVRLEAVRNGTEGASPEGAGTEPSKRRYVPGRTYPQLVTEEAEPDEDLVYGDAAPVVVEWRRARGRVPQDPEDRHCAGQDGGPGADAGAGGRHRRGARADAAPGHVPLGRVRPAGPALGAATGPHAGAGEAEPGVAATVAAPRSHLQTVAGLGGVRSLRNGS